MAQTSYLQQFIDANANFIAGVLLTPICKWLKENPEEEVTEEKLMEVLKLPAPVASPATKTPQRVTSTQPLTTAASKRTRTTKAATPSAERPRCAWVFTKGTNQGKQCPGYATDDSKYCSACRNKKGAGGSGRKASEKDGEKATTTKSTAVKAATGAAGKAAKGSLTAPKKTKEPEPVEDDDYEPDENAEGTELLIIDFATAKDGSILVLEEKHRYVLKDIGDDNFIAVGRSTDGQTMKPLTKEEKAEVKRLFDFDYEDGVTLD